ncbi:hypothetical protein DL765_003652 [Monosporascus sp. GIB2]|nr:hypothetical protein DL765_003652 [Monosporascus sp. GIB2]
MFEHFELRHIPALFTATVMTFGGMWSYFDARGAMLEFGLPDRIANTPAAAAVMHINNARTTVLGMCMYTLYFRRELVACFRLVSSGLLSAVGFAGWTAGR